ncbi:MAG: DUF4276 family protein [Bacteroidetes bacterium]|jgi:hypothetical protein|nr:DUF4276 family protein [Bacteroidota bacterium]
MQIQLAAYTEGPTDDRFVPTIIERTARRLLSQEGTGGIEVLPVQPITVQSKGVPGLREAALRTHGYHALVVHADSDYRDPSRAMQERIQPGLDEIEQLREKGRPVCTSIVPMIPVRTIESWMLADAEALSSAIGINTPPKDLPLPDQPHQVEGIDDPKGRIQEIINRSVSGRRRRPHPGTLYAPVAQRIDLTVLEGVPSYQRFAEQLEVVFRQQGLVE